jgi:hypothetical protein
MFWPTDLLMASFSEEERILPSDHDFAGVVPAGLGAVRNDAWRETSLMILSIRDIARCTGAHLVILLALGMFALFSSPLRAEAPLKPAAREDQLLGCWKQIDYKFKNLWKFCFEPRGKGSYSAIEAGSLHVSDFSWTADRTRGGFVVRWKQRKCRSAWLTFEGDTLAGSGCDLVWRLSKVQSDGGSK